MQIGRFRKTASGFEGWLRTLALNFHLRLVPAPHSDAERAPDWQLQCADGDPVEVGAGWNRESGKGLAFIALQIDCPSLARPIRANLLRAKTGDDAHVLLWLPRRRRPMED